MLSLTQSWYVKGEDEVLQPENTEAMREVLVPLATIVTPNLFEAGQLAKTGPIKSIDEMKNAAAIIHEIGASNVVIKGGADIDHEKAVDLFYDGKDFTLLEENKLETTYNHGAGCTFAAAITATLPKEKLLKAVEAAKAFVTAAIKSGWKMNDFVGPVKHGAYNEQK